jgi:AhpD family alkylhydroperoxidase
MLCKAGEFLLRYLHLLEKKKIDYYNIAPDGLKITMEIEKYINNIDLLSDSKELIKIRVSQINGCAFWVNMHSLNAQKSGETDQRIAVATDVVSGGLCMKGV